MAGPWQTNPMRANSPLGDAFANLAKAFITPVNMAGQKTPEELELLRAQRAKYEAETANAQRKGAAGARLQELGMKAFGPRMEAARPSPDAMGPMPAMPRDEQVRSVLPGMMGALGDGGDIGQVGALFRALMANAPGTSDAATVRSMVGAGNALGVNDAVSLDGQADVAERNAVSDRMTKLAEIRATPMSLSQAQAVEFNALPQPTRAITVGPSKTNVDANTLMGGTDEQRMQAAGGNAPPGTPRNYRTGDGRAGITMDGRTDETGQPLPQGTILAGVQDTAENVAGNPEHRAAREDVMARRISTANVVAGTNGIIDTLAQAPANNPQAMLGVIGSSAGMLNGLRSQIEGGYKLLGWEVTATRDPAIHADVLQNLAGGNAELQAALMDLAFVTASAREPGKLTDADIRNALITLGKSPDPQVLSRTLATAAQRAVQRYQTAENVYTQQYPNLGLAPFQAPQIKGAVSVPPGGGGGAAPSAGGGRRVIDLYGNSVQ